MQISGIQTDVTLGDRAANLQRMQAAVETEVAAGSQLIVFPECFTSGYCFDSKDEAMQHAETMDGESVRFAAELCRRHNCSIVFGMLERDGDRLFNVAALVGPQGLIGSYRKTHLPFLGVDRFTSFGDRPYEVFDVGGVRVGMLICYDGGFPEASRVLAVRGADIILLPTNWPPGAEYMSCFSINARAMENGLYFLAVDRIGKERGFSFIGRSRFCDPVGATLDSADHADPAVIRATIDVSKARTKTIVRVPGKHIIDRMADRRPELYSPLTEPHSLPRPGRSGRSES
ncbi:MAG: carbon-nitrogen hydrolase family protein [Planctomycetaceae bacterium]